MADYPISPLNIGIVQFNDVVVLALSVFMFYSAAPVLTAAIIHANTASY